MKYAYGALALAAVVDCAPVDRRAFPSLPSGFPSLGGTGTSGGFPSLPSFSFPSGFPSLPSGFPALPSGFPSLGGSGSSSFPFEKRSFPSLPLPSGFPKLGGTGTSGGFPSLPSGFPSLPSGFPSFPKFGGSGTSGGFPSLPSGLPEIGTILSEDTSDSATSTKRATGSCKAVTLVFARGTTELGTLGEIVGPTLSSNLNNDISGGITTVGVDYPASIAGNADLGASGGPTMAKDAEAALASCPDTKIVLAGYSQGAMVVHNSLNTFSPTKVAAIAVFGDPLQIEGFKGIDKSKIVNYCGSADPVCDTGGSDTSGSHLVYGSDTAAAAKKIAAIVGGTTTT